MSLNSKLHSTTASTQEAIFKIKVDSRKGGAYHGHRSHKDVQTKGYKPAKKFWPN